MKPWLFAMVLALSGMVSGCWIFLLDNPDDPEPTPVTPRPAATSTVNPPHVDDIQVADWPPVGPSEGVQVSVTDDVGLQSLTASFRNSVQKSLSGKERTLTLLGKELGEGFGTLQVRVFDTQGAWAEREVTKLLVDLSPPEVVLGNTVLPRNTEVGPSELQFWVADAWVLGWVELSFEGILLRHEFPHLYPATLGTDWDVSQVSFSTATLPATKSMATIVASDAAGNTMKTSFLLSIDGTAPQATILKPLPGETVSGEFSVRVSTQDVESNAASIEVTVGGGSPTTLQGPTAEVTFHTQDFGPGTLEIRAVAIDEAGNHSTPAVVQVLVQE